MDSIIQISPPNKIQKTESKKQIKVDDVGTYGFPQFNQTFQKEVEPIAYPTDKSNEDMFKHFDHELSDSSFVKDDYLFNDDCMIAKNFNFSCWFPWSFLK